MVRICLAVVSSAEELVKSGLRLRKRALQPLMAEVRAGISSYEPGVRVAPREDMCWAAGEDGLRVRPWIGMGGEEARR